MPKACRGGIGAGAGGGGGAGRRSSKPTGAGAKGCRLHLSLHGCDVNGYYDPAVHHLGFENWAEANGMVVLFPRMADHGATHQTLMGCWDAYAQTGADYALKSGAQMAAVRQMIRAVAGR